MTGILGGALDNPAGRGLIISPASSIPFSIEPCKGSPAGEPETSGDFRLVNRSTSMVPRPKGRMDAMVLEYKL